jgi:transcription-repair coupling factor (superfamily II helicase)
MDRLVCGDVGYGKTEVAVRAAFKAAMEGKQVAVLVPTTILAQQHFQTFSRRLKPYPLEIQVLSRFRTAKEQKETLRQLKDGRVDVVIGTHRLLSVDVEFHDLGLVVVDEEHRFGVKHKEKLKQLKKTVDVLTLTATPIPRTLHMSMLGLRDLSIIDTPPPDRQAIHTELARFDEHLIREAVLRELRRQGQGFFVINRVHEIEAMAGWLRRLVPEARLAVAHGQMHERALEKVMREFVEKKTDLLVTTAIIESGLDIPSANTLLVHRADQFGLAQLYQLRGRIGRSKERGYAYFLIPGLGLITPEAMKRLKALKDFTELGSGFRLASHDLQIRGAGNILGAQQSGQIARVGFELYSQLLDEATQKLKGEEKPSEIEPELKLQVPAFLPETYIPSAKERVTWYKRFSMVHDEAEIKDLREELLDRYGPRPEEVENLAQVMAIKTLLKQVRARGVEFNGQVIGLHLGEAALVDPDRVLALLRSAPNRYRLTPDHHLYARHPFSSPAALFDAVRALLAQILPPDSRSPIPDVRRKR